MLLIRPLDPVTSRQRAAYGLAFFVLFVAVWAWATFGGYVSKTFLANPLTMLQEGWDLLTKHGFLFDIGMTIWRVIGGFTLAAIVAGATIWLLLTDPVTVLTAVDEGQVSPLVRQLADIIYNALAGLLDYL